MESSSKRGLDWDEQNERTNEHRVHDTASDVRNVPRTGHIRDIIIKVLTYMHTLRACFLCSSLPTYIGSHTVKPGCMHLEVCK